MEELFTKKVTEATLYTHIDILGETTHTLVAKDNWGDVTETSVSTTDGSDYKTVIEHGLAWARSRVGNEVRIDYSSNKNVSSSASNTRLLVASQINEARTSHNKAVEHFYTLLG